MSNEADNLLPDGSPEEQDALRSIGDIGPRYAEALRQIGIHTPTDLARYTPETLAQELREKAGVRVTPDRIRVKDWIGQARELAERQHTAADPDRADDAAEHPEGEMPAEENPVNTHSPGARDIALHERGMFTVRFMEGYDPQGRQVWQAWVYTEGGTGPEMPFDGMDPNAWVQWMFEQMGLPAEPVERPDSYETLEMVDGSQEPETSTSQVVSPEAQIMELEDVGVAFEEVDVNAWPPAPARWLEVEAHFHFEGEHARELAQEQAPFLIEFYLIDLKSQSSSQICSNQGQMEPERIEYSVRQNFAMPAPGQYELQTILLLRNQNTRAFRDGPVFQVVTEEPHESL